MEPLNRPQAIIQFCLAPLDLDPQADTTKEVYRRMEHVIKTYQAKIPQPVAVDFSRMPTFSINEAAHGFE
jgi:hypothetical protein